MKSVLLIGLGRFGRHIARELDQLGHQVMAIDKEEERIEAVLPWATGAQIGDSTNEDFLESLEIPGYDLCIVAIGSDFQSSLETTSLLKDLGAHFVVSRAERDVQTKFLLRNGADEVVYPERQMGKWTAIRYSSENILDYIELNDSHSVFEISVPEAWVNRTIGEIDIRRRYHINIIALMENGKMNIAITSDTVLHKDCSMLVLGEHKYIEKCFLK